jgi:F0F1-type ATP synthase membrane subunit b/b'
MQAMPINRQIVLAFLVVLCSGKTCQASDVTYHPYSSHKRHPQEQNDANDTLAHMRDQAESLKSEREQANELYARHVENEGNAKAQRIIDQARQDAQPYRDLAFGRRAAIPRAVGDDIENRARQEAEAEKKAALATAERYRLESKASSDSLSSTVDNLQSQIDAPVIRDGVRLSPTRSNLYVRNYEH